MHYLSAAFFFLLFSIPRSDTVVMSFDISGIQKDLTEFNRTCNNRDKCSYHAPSDSFSFRDCHCGKHCVDFGTCCLDSIYVGAPKPKLKPACRAVYNGAHYFIVDRCSSTDSVWESLCNAEWDGEEDLQKIVPVTSISTNITYKNYYCFRCHEETNEFLNWTVNFNNPSRVRNSSKGESELLYGKEENISLIYNKDLNTWTTLHNDEYYSVKLSVTTYSGLNSLTHTCVPDVISECSSAWFDEEVRSKCESYMDIKRVTMIEKRHFIAYKNTHCALCNFRSLDSIGCWSRERGYDKDRNENRDRGEERYRGKDRHIDRDEDRYIGRDRVIYEDRHRDRDEDRYRYRDRDEGRDRVRDVDRYRDRDEGLDTSCDTVVMSFDISGIQKDLTEFNRTCNNRDKCSYHAPSDSFSWRDCHCGKHCVDFGTCCLDSIYAGDPQPILKTPCRSVHNGGHYFIVDRCSSPDSVWESLCNAEWNGDDDLQKIVPVTSISTNITYKNYYCFRCHEATNKFLYWAVKFENPFIERYSSNGESKLLRGNEKNISMIYNKDLNKWTTFYNEEHYNFSVNLSVEPSSSSHGLEHICIPDVISKCSDEWSDEEVRNKCQSYTAMKKITKNDKFVKYKNIHCALCNFESLNSMKCLYSKEGFSFGILLDINNSDGDKVRKSKTCPSGYLWDIFSKKCRKLTSARPFSFSFRYLLDINRFDGGLVPQRCSDEHLWDPYTQKCRKLTCALPEYKLKNGKCFPE